MNDRSYEFYVNHELTEYSGKWVAIIDEEVVASDKNTRVVLEEADKKHAGRQPLLAKVPKGEILVL